VLYLFVFVSIAAITDNYITRKLDQILAKSGNFIKIQIPYQYSTAAVPQQLL